MYNPTYYRNKMGSFVKQNSFASIFAGTDAYFLEDELNELQWIQNEARASIVRKLVRSSFHTKGAIELDSSIQNGFILGKSEVIINGYEVTLANNKNRSDEKNTILLSDPPTSGTRDDLIFVEAWFEEVTGSNVVYAYGGVESGTLTNTILDTRIGAETSRRIQLRWRIRVVDGVNITTYPLGIDDTSAVFAQGGKTSNTIYTFTQSTDDEGLFITGTGSDTDKTALQSADGYVYAIPATIINRLNSSIYDALTNPNGATVYVDSSSVSTRPDGKFSNLVYPDQITDKMKQSETTFLKMFQDTGNGLKLNSSFIVNGDLTVNGTTTTINTTELNVSDNVVRLNNDFTGSTPTENAGIEVERGGLPNTSLLWDESNGKWTATNNGSNFYDILLSDQKAAANGLASLDASSKIPYTQFPTLPSSVTYIVHPTTNLGNYTTIQEAINALPSTGGMIYVREGTYNELLTLKSNVVIIGQGYSTIVKMNNAINADSLVTGDTISNVKIKNIKLDVNTTNQTNGKNIAVSLYNSSYIDIEDIYVENAKDKGIHLDTVYNSSIKSNAFKNVTGNGVFNYGDPISNKDGNEITSNKFESCGTAIELDVNSSYNLVTNNIIRSCTSGIINSGNGNTIANNQTR